MIQNCCLHQVVDFPTEFNNCLDIFLTNRPSLVSSCIALPGIGDHNIVSVESSISVNRRKPARRKIFLWNRMDVAGMKGDCLSFQATFMSHFDATSPIQAMWADIKTNLSKSSTSTCFPRWLQQGLISLGSTPQWNAYPGEKSVALSSHGVVATLKTKRGITPWRNRQGQHAKRPSIIILLTP